MQISPRRIRNQRTSELHRHLGQQVSRSASVLAAGFLLIVIPASTGASDWNQFRGPHRTGVALGEANLLRSWPDGGPPMLWKRSLGEGFSGISVGGDLLFTLFATAGEAEGGDREFVAAFHRATGELVWRIPLGEKFVEPFGNGPRSTPTVDGETVYALSSTGRLVAADVNDGTIHWQLELTEKYGIHDPQTLNPIAAQSGLQLPLYGYTGSPLIYGNLLLVETGAGHGRSLVALDKTSGQEKWTALDTEIGYSSPTVAQIGGEPQIVLTPKDAIVGVSTTGQPLWEYPWNINPSQPLFVAPNLIFVSTVNEMGAALLEIVESEGGEFVAQPKWKIHRLRNSWNSSLIYEGTIYGFDHSTFRSLELETGELLWAHRGLGQGTLIFADGLLIVLSDKGRLVLVEATPEAYREKGSVDILEGKTWTSPTLSEGVIYVRSHAEMAALDLKGGSPAP